LPTTSTHNYHDYVDTENCCTNALKGNAEIFMLLFNKLLYWLGLCLIFTPVWMLGMGFFLIFILGCSGIDEGGGGHCATGGDTAKTWILTLLILGSFGGGFFVIAGALFLTIYWILSFWIH
jgi:hypothetical protein